MESDAVQKPKESSTPTASETIPSLAGMNMTTVHTNTILHALLVMQKHMDKDTGSSRTSFMLTKLLQTRQELLRLAEEQGITNPPMWFDVPVPELTALHYCRFVYTFINIAFNPKKVLAVQLDSGTKNDDGTPKFTTTGTSECTFADAAVHFEYFNGLHSRFVEFLKPLCTPLTREIADMGLTFYDLVRFNLAETQRRFDALAEQNKAYAQKRNLRAGETRAKVVELAYRSLFEKLYARASGDNTTHVKKQHADLAKELKVPAGLVHLLYLWALDVAHDESKQERLKEVADAMESKKEAERKAAEAAAATNSDKNSLVTKQQAPDLRDILTDSSYTLTTNASYPVSVSVESLGSGYIHNAIPYAPVVETPLRSENVSATSNNEQMSFLSERLTESRTTTLERRVQTVESHGQGVMLAATSDPLPATDENMLPRFVIMEGPVFASDVPVARVLNAQGEDMLPSSLPLLDTTL